MADVKPATSGVPGTAGTSVSGSTTGRPASLRAERAEVTRHRIAQAARLRFSRDGYGATTLRDVAAEAGVAVQTVYAVYGSKAGILRVLRESVMTQGEAGAAVAEAMRAETPGRALDLFARSIRHRWEQTGDIVAIHTAAATIDPIVRGGVEETLRVRRAGIGALAATLAGGLEEGVSPERATAIMSALSLPELFSEMVDVLGWTPDEYEAWLAGTLRRELLRR